MAQPGRALRSGRRGRGFKSPCPDHIYSYDIHKFTNPNHKGVVMKASFL